MGALAQGQNGVLSGSYLSGVNSRAFAASTPTSLLPGFLSSDQQQLFRPKSPLLMTLASSTTFKSGNYWMGTMTTQSYNQGKLGTYYLWDVQGNLRESRMFLDIAGKNKRGLKLIFRRR
jgi:hypothetical protein